MNYVLPTEKLINNISNRNAIFLQYSENVFGSSPVRQSTLNEKTELMSFSQCLKMCHNTKNPLKTNLEDENENFDD